MNLLLIECIVIFNFFSFSFQKKAENFGGGGVCTPTLKYTLVCCHLNAMQTKNYFITYTMNNV